jgi:hypothetical protein
MSPNPRLRSTLLLIVCSLSAVPTQAAAEEPPIAPRVESSTRNPEWGGADRVLYSVMRSEFSPLSSGITYAESSGRYSTIPDGVFSAGLHLPSGALLTYFELDYCDNSGSANVILSLADCNFLLTLCVVNSQLNSGSGNPGCNYVSADISGFGMVVNNNTRKYFLTAVTEAGNFTTQISGAYIGYKLQVSPAPASATFLDVPTSHPYFRFVEALVDAGITSGCGGGNYCVNSPITRGEMAVFLAAALGLHFPN